jgi:hypothetical protein
MGIATDHAPAPPGGLKPYTLWEIDVRMFNDDMVEIAAFSCRQDLWVGEGQFAVRLTPLKKDGKDYAPYEDRGDVDKRGVITGVSGMGGKLKGRLLQNNGVFLQGKGGAADYLLVATQTGPEHYRCYRQFEFHQSMTFWGIDFHPGAYFFTTEDQIIEQSDQPPPEMRTPAAAAS